MAPFTFVYYCSGHGYGHATRVSAFACHLLNLPEPDRPTIYVVSSAPEHVFSACVERGAVYRCANIDPVIVQPLAYRVDRQKSVEVLKSFLSKKDVLLEAEKRWLVSVNASCVLSDAAFLGCLAAKAAGIPSILITNFTFDSVYSYLATTILDTPSSESEHLAPEHRHSHFTDLLGPDVPISITVLSPLVEHIYAGYRCADLLLLLPGYIPIPSFSVYPPLPSSDWVDSRTRKFNQEILSFLQQPSFSYVLHPSIPFPGEFPPHLITRKVISAPLLVRSPTSCPSVYTPAGRSQLLSSLGVPPSLHDPKSTKVLIVSFGGQVFRRPSRSGSGTPSRRSSHDHTPPHEGTSVSGSPPSGGVPKLEYKVNGHTINDPALSPSKNANKLHALPNLPIPSPPSDLDLVVNESDVHLSPTSKRLATPSHIWIPGAPPASKPLPSPTSNLSPSMSASTPSFTEIPPTPSPSQSSYFNGAQPDLTGIEEFPRLLPDSSWIAVVCGVSKQQWIAEGEDQDSDLPDNFFVAPRDVYMPDLTAVGDVLLGKLGYGTVSECVDSCTPFVYVSRPLFIEEHGLRLLLDGEGVGVELSRQSYEAGDWAAAVDEAWVKGSSAKARKRKDGEAGIGLQKTAEEGGKMARQVVEWVEDWWAPRPSSDATEDVIL